MMTIIYIVIAVIVVLGIAIAMQPGQFRVTRSTNIAAPAELVFSQVNDLHNWQAWSPWAKLDPNAKNVYEGAAAGVGAAFVWSGNMKVGAGRMTISESRPNELIRIALDFEKPMKARNVAEFSFKAAGDQTSVTWSMTGKNNFVGKAVGLVINCDKMCGGMFDKGLADLKSLVETTAKASR